MAMDVDTRSSIVRGLFLAALAVAITGCEKSPQSSSKTSAPSAAPALPQTPPSAATSATPPTQAPAAPGISPPPPAQAATPESKLELPEFYGLYAVIGGKPVGMREGGEPANLEPAVEFLWFNKSVAMADVHLFELDLKATSAGRQSVDSVLSGVPTGAGRVEMRQKPIRNQPEMVLYVPSATLKPGLYQVGVERSNSRFWVDRSGFIAAQASAARAALAVDDWDTAVACSAVLLKVDPQENAWRMMHELGVQGVNARKRAADERRARLTRESREETGVPFSSDQELMLCSFHWCGDRHFAKRVTRVEITNVNAKFTWREHWSGSKGWQGANENYLASETGKDKIFTLWFDQLGSLDPSDAPVLQYASRVCWEKYPSGGDCDKCLVVFKIDERRRPAGGGMYPMYELLFHVGGREAIYNPLRKAFDEWRTTYAEILQP